MEDKIYKILRNKLTADQAMQVAKQVDDMLNNDSIVLKQSPINLAYDLIVSFESEGKAVVKKKTIDPPAMELAEMLAGHVLELYPHYKRTYRQENWAKDIQALHKTDEMDYQLIEAVIRWLFTIYQPSSTFDWRQQVRSGANLRKHFLKLYDQAKSDYQATEIQEIR